MADGADKEAGGGPDQAAIEAKAKSMGWVPKEEFRGDPERFTDAAEYVRRGEEMLPIVRAENRRLQEQLNLQAQHQRQLEADARAAKEAVEALKQSNAAIAEQKRKDQQKEIRRQLAEARKAENTELELQLEEQLEELRQPPKEEPAKQGTQQQQTAPAIDASTQQFMAENSWFGTDKRRTALAMAIGQELRNDPANAGLQGAAFYAKVKEEVFKEMPLPGQARQTSKVESGSSRAGSSNGGGGSGQTYSDLPADAKAACERQASKIVGKGRAYETMADWRKAYAELYFNS